MAAIALVTDLFFSTKITGTGKALGTPVLVARTLQRLQELLDAVTAENLSGPVLLIVDLNITAVDPMAAIRLAKGHAAMPRVVGFLSHVQVDLAAAAREAGADQVMARSAFTTQLPELLAPVPPNPPTSAG